MLTLVPTLALLGLAAASPIARKNMEQWSVPSYINVTYQSPMNKELPSVFILATGGTIAGSGASSTASGVYSAGAIGVEALVEAVPELLNISNIYGVQVANVDSIDMNSTIRLELAKYANDILCSEGSTIDSVIVTHGTDTLEETAFFLDATVNCGKPVVVVGAMRPSTAISADGPANLYQGIQAGIFPESKNRGTLIVLNDRIGAAFYTQKTHINYLDTFKAPEPGYLGGFFNNQPFYYYEAAKPYFKNEFDISNVDTLPRVDILYGHQETDARIINYTADLEDVAGIIMASPNGGEGVSEALTRAAGIKPVVRHTRINVGMIAPEATVPEGNATISAGLVNTQKSRILLQLALATGADPRKVFEATLRGTLFG